LSGFSPILYALPTLFTYFDNTHCTHTASLSLRARGEKWLEKQLFIDWFKKQVTTPIPSQRILLLTQKT
jgi:hypothetical protein